VPEAVPAGTTVDAIAQLRQEISQMKQQFGEGSGARAAAQPRFITAACEVSESGIRASGVAGWRVKTLLEESGLLPVHAAAIMDDLAATFGERPPDALAKQMDLARSALVRRWKRPVPLTAEGVHVFVGPPGAGKTTCLCKWLAQSVFIEAAVTEVYRLDSNVANTAESLSIYGDILGVPVSRCLEPGTRETMSGSGKRYLIDFPGVNPADAGAMRELGQRLRELPKPTVHLVLNAAYDTRLIMSQVRAFESLGVDDLVVTHLDEEPRWGKLWNLVLGTNYALRFLNSGQNVPGEFVTASPERILAGQFQQKPEETSHCHTPYRPWQTSC
jgi:flagellar biosynthesis GTPase FlhF